MQQLYVQISKMSLTNAVTTMTNAVSSVTSKIGITSSNDVTHLKKIQTLEKFTRDNARYVAWYEKHLAWLKGKVPELKYVNVKLAGSRCIIKKLFGNKYTFAYPESDCEGTISFPVSEEQLAAIKQDFGNDVCEDTAVEEAKIFPYGDRLNSLALLQKINAVYIENHLAEEGKVVIGSTKAGLAWYASYPVQDKIENEPILAVDTICAEHVVPHKLEFVIKSQEQQDVVDKTIFEGASKFTIDEMYEYVTEGRKQLLEQWTEEKRHEKAIRFLHGEAIRVENERHAAAKKAIEAKQAKRKAWLKVLTQSKKPKTDAK